MTVSLDISDDMDVFDNTSSATYTQYAPDGTASATASVTALRQGVADTPAGFQSGLIVGKTTWHVKAEELSAAGIEPARGDTLAVATGLHAGTYVVEMAGLQSWDTRWELTCQRVEGDS